MLIKAYWFLDTVFLKNINKDKELQSLKSTNQYSCLNKSRVKNCDVKSDNIISISVNEYGTYIRILEYNQRKETNYLIIFIWEFLSFFTKAIIFWIKRLDFKFYTELIWNWILIQPITRMFTYTSIQILESGARKRWLNGHYL